MCDVLIFISHEPCKCLSEQRILTVGWLKAHSDAVLISSLRLGDNPPIWFGATGNQGKETTKHTQLTSVDEWFLCYSALVCRVMMINLFEDCHIYRTTDQKPWVHIAQVNMANRRRWRCQMERGWRQYKMEYVQSEGWTCTICKTNGRECLQRKITRATKINKKKPQSEHTESRCSQLSKNH